MDTFIFSLGGAIIISLVSFVGVVVLTTRVRKNDFIIASLVAFASGALLGDAFLHLLNEHIEVNGFELKTIGALLAGILFMLFFEAYFHCSHDSTEELHQHENHDRNGHAVLAKQNILGEVVHNFLDGIAIASSFIVSPLVGLTSIIAVALHEIPQEIADVSILVLAGWGRKKVLVVNFLVALTSIAGVLLVFVARSFVEGVELFFVPFAAGQFIYIALADLAPEVHRHKGSLGEYFVKMLMFVLGIFLMFLLLGVE